MSTKAIPAPTDSPWLSQRLLRARDRLTLGLLISLLMHALLLSLTFGDDESGLPGLGFPWQDRRGEVPELRVVLEPAATTEPQPTTGESPAAPNGSPPAPSLPMVSPTEGGLPARPLSETTPLNNANALAWVEPPAPPRTVPNPESAQQETPRKEVLQKAATGQHTAPLKEVRQEVPQNKMEPMEAEEQATPRQDTAQQPAAEARQVQAAQLEAERQNTARREAVLVAAAGLEAIRQEAIRQELAQAEVARIEAEGLEAVRQRAAKQEAAQQAAARTELARVERERQEEARQASARQEALRQDAARQEAVRAETERQEAALKQAAQAQAARDEQARQDSARQQAARTEASRLEAERQEATRQEAVRMNAARQATALADAARQEAARAAATQLEAERQDAAAQAAARQDAVRQETERQAAAKLAAAQQAAAREDARREQAAQAQAKRLDAARAAEQREERLKAIGRQLNEEADRRAAATAARPASTLPSSWSSARRGRIFGRSDSNEELLRYAEAWSRKIELNMTFDAIREAAKQPHTDPVVMVAVRSDGSVESVSFVRSSGVAALDEAIRSVVQSQASYQAFQPALAREFDVVEIRRTWHFDMAIRLY